MDNLTHSLVGALIGQAGLKRRTGLAMPALVIGANLPDVDAACLFWLDGVEHLGFRRGITHGPPAMVLLPLLLAGLLWGFDRWQARRGTRPEGRAGVSFKWLFLLSFIGCLTHPALDWLNIYGIRLLEPFSSRWFYGDTLFIIDVWLWALMGFATWFSLRREERGGEWRKPAWAALAAATAYIGFNHSITRDAESIETLDGEKIDTIASPVPVAFWSRDLIRVGRYGLHEINSGYSGPSETRLQRIQVGDAYLLACDLRGLAAKDSQVRAFLFWSRVPYIEERADGTIWLRDARFIDPLAGDRFAVSLPRSVCGAGGLRSDLEELPRD